MSAMFTGASHADTDASWGGRASKSTDANVTETCAELDDGSRRAYPAPPPENIVHV